MFGPVRVTRIAYRARGQANLHPANGVLNLPEEEYSHGLRRLAAVESSRGSFDGALDVRRHWPCGRRGGRSSLMVRLSGVWSAL